MFQMQSLLCVLPSREPQWMVPRAPRVQLSAGSQHQCCRDLRPLSASASQHTPPRYHFHARMVLPGGMRNLEPPGSLL